MAVKVELNGGPDAPTSWTDITNFVAVFKGMRVGGNAHLGGIGTGSGFDLDDDAGEIILPVKRVVRVRETHTSPDTILLRGRIADKGVSRGGGGHIDDARSYDVELDDGNAELRGIPIRRWPRPEESDYRRVVALWRRYLKGSPRATTRLHIKYRSGPYEGLGSVRNANRVTLPKQVYTDTDPYGVLKDVAEAAGKEFFVTVDDEIFYDLPTSTRYHSSILITDEDPNDTDEFPPDAEAKADQDGSEFLSGVVVTYGHNKRVARVRSTIESQHDFWREVIAEDATGAADARKRAQALMSRQAHEDRTYTVVLELTEDEIDLIKYGQTISYEASGTGVKTATTLRIGRLLWEPTAPRRYRAHLELGFPKKMVPRIDRTSRGTNPGNGTDDGGGTVTPPPTGGGDSSLSPVLIDDFDGETTTVGESLLDDWTRPILSTRPYEVARNRGSTTGTSHAVPLAAGSDIPGNMILLAYTSTAADPSAQIPSQLVIAGFEQRESFVDSSSTSGGLFAKYVDGSDGFDPENPTFTITTPGSETISWVAITLTGVATSGAGLSNSIAASRFTPSVSGWAGETELAYVFGFDSQAVTGGVTPFYTLAENLTPAGAALRVLKADVTGAINPPDFSAPVAAAIHTVTVAVRFVQPEWGAIPRGNGVDHDGPWVGHNAYEKHSIGSATVRATSGVGTIAIASDGTVVEMRLRSDAADDPNAGEPGPWSEGNGVFRYLWKVNTMGDLADADENLVEWQITTQDWNGIFRVHLGDAVSYPYQSGYDERGVVIIQNSTTPVYSDFVPKTLVGNAYYWTKFDTRGDTVKMKIWGDGLAEPDWDIETAKIPEDPGEDDVEWLSVRVYGNTGMTFSFDTAYAQIGEDTDPNLFGEIDTHAGDAAWWSGGNPWTLEAVSGAGNYGQDASSLFVEGDGSDVEIEIAIGPSPETPLYISEAAEVPWSLTGLFRYTGDDDDGGGDPNRFLKIIGPRDSFTIDFDEGSALLSLFILAGGNDSATLPLVPDTWYRFRFRKGATTTGVRVWADGGLEPDTFDVSQDSVWSTATDQLKINIGAEGVVGPFRVELDALWADAPDGSLNGTAGEVYGLTPAIDVP